MCACPLQQAWISASAKALTTGVVRDPSKMPSAHETRIPSCRTSAARLRWLTISHVQQLHQPTTIGTRRRRPLGGVLSRHRRQSRQAPHLVRLRPQGGVQEAVCSVVAVGWRPTGKGASRRSGSAYWTPCLGQERQRVRCVDSQLNMCSARNAARRCSSLPVPRVGVREESAGSRTHVTHVLGGVRWPAEGFARPRARPPRHGTTASKASTTERRSVSPIRALRKPPTNRSGRQIGKKKE